MESQDKVKISYETLWKFIIRPPKDDYTEDLLGSKSFTYRGKAYVRKDYNILSSEGYIMKCSFVEPEESHRPQIEMPVVLYLHGNSSSRMEGMRMAEELLKRDINLFLIDFPGCGLSEGEYISLGYHEADDVGIVVDFIEKLPGVGKIGLWGRSMGAATTMIYTHRDPRIKAICMDSPFSEFNRLAKELTLKQIKLPNFMVDAALSFVRSTIKKKNGLDIYKLRPIDAAKKTKVPAIFIHAINDELINLQHSVDLFNAYEGTKSLKCCEKGGHNARRPGKIIKQVGEFFYKYLSTNAFEDEELENNIIHSYPNNSDNSKQSTINSDFEKEEELILQDKNELESIKKKDLMQQKQFENMSNIFKNMSKGNMPPSTEENGGK